MDVARYFRTNGIRRRCSWYLIEVIVCDLCLGLEKVFSFGIPVWRNQLLLIVDKLLLLTLLGLGLVSLVLLGVLLSTLIV